MYVTKRSVFKFFDGSIGLDIFIETVENAATLAPSLMYNVVQLATFSRFFIFIIRPPPELLPVLGPWERWRATYT